jgi:hypothetical protein
MEKQLAQIAGSLAEQDVLEWSNFTNEGPVALVGHGGPTICVTVDPLTPTGIVIHWAHGQDSIVERYHNTEFRDLLQNIPAGDNTYVEGHPSRVLYPHLSDQISPEIAAHIADGTLVDLTSGADAGGKQ